MNKRGISPVIATVLLISIALVLAAIIFLWARSFLGEQTQKEGEPVANSCDRVNFEVEASETSVDVVNRGNIPLYGLELRVKDAQTGEVTSRANVFSGGRTNVLKGESGSVKFNPPLLKCSKITILPIILGEKNTVPTPFACDVESAREAVVQLCAGS